MSQGRASSTRSLIGTVVQWSAILAVTLPVAGTPVMRNWHVIHLVRKRLSPIAQGFKDFLRVEGAALVRKTVGFDAG